VEKGLWIVVWGGAGAVGAVDCVLDGNGRDIPSETRLANGLRLLFFGPESIPGSGAALVSGSES
jgi:hypothetical protein